MAQGKKSFVAYADWKETFDVLPNEEAGILIKHIFSYVNDENPISDSILINAVFANIKTTLKRDLILWEQRAERSRENGSKGGRPKDEKPKRTQLVISKPKKPDSVNVSVSVNDSEIYKQINHLFITKKDFEKLKINFNEKEILDCFDRIENYKGNTKYTSLYLTAKNWLEKEKKDNQKNNTDGKIISTTKPTFRNSFQTAFNNNQQANVSNTERELSEDTEFTIVE